MTQHIKPTIACVIGTRPEVLKMAPLIKQLNLSGRFHVKTVLSAQHRDLLDQFVEQFAIEVDADFNSMRVNQSLSNLTATLLAEFDDYFSRLKPDMVIAQGDTTTTFCAALAAFYKQIPFAHVEAGLRTYSLEHPFPEELNRVVADKIATIHFAPTQESQSKLKKEGLVESVFVVGNTIIDTLYDELAKQTASGQASEKESDRRKILVTCHRRENLGESLENICRALRLIVENNPYCEIVFPVHPNPKVKDVVFAALEGIERIRLCEPLGYSAFVRELQSAYLVLTDSGGLQEEAPALGKPVLVMRSKTERVEAIACGAVRLVGVATDQIVSEVERLLEDAAHYARMASAGSPYGDGKASQRIVAIIESYLLGNKNENPTATSPEFICDSETA